MAYSVQPALALLALALVTSDAPLRARFELSRGAMDAAARAVLAGKRDPDDVHRVGLYSVERAERVGGSFRFLVRGTGFFDSGGFAYSPHGRPPRVGEDEYTHYRGPWYIWSESF